MKLRLRFLGVLSVSFADGCDSMIEVAVTGPSLGIVTVVVATRRSWVEISIFLCHGPNVFNLNVCEFEMWVNELENYPLAGSSALGAILIAF